jgi:hypothetical protein
MRILTAFLLFLSASLMACADDCPPESISLYPDQDFHVQVLFDTAPARSTEVQLYSGDELMRTIVADHDGAFRLDHLPEGKYRFVLPRKGNLDLLVLPGRSGLNGPWITWSLFPKSKFKWVAGKKVAGRACPIVAVKED